MYRKNYENDYRLTFEHSGLTLEHSIKYFAVEMQNSVEGSTIKRMVNQNLYLIYI